MTVLRFLYWDQLSYSISSLREGDPDRDIVILCETRQEATSVPHHKKKLAFLFAAMRHFAQELVERGFQVRYVKLDDPQNSGSILDELTRAVAELKPTQVVITEPSEWHLVENLKTWRAQQNTDVHILPDFRFLAMKDEFKAWAGSKKQLRMEFFYREMRKKHHILMEADGTPTGGQWNYDQENRKPPAKGMTSPRRISHAPSTHLMDVLDLVETHFPQHFGTLRTFHYALTRDQALRELRHFIDELLPLFGDYQDAMVAGEPYLYHSLMSSYLNAGLLLPLEMCQMAEEAYREGRAPLNAVEGFIRQILGWREYVRGIYWHFMPQYAELNHFDATRPLPDFYWSAATHMFCVAEAVRHTRDHAYSHHIQRLMVTGNFALLAGLDVREVQEWYLAVYSDAFEWVEMPNTLGMALWGDGGLMASKPYAASGKYIHRMSNFCAKCRYDPNELVGERACPFNALYWDFVGRHQDKLRTNQRMSYMYATWDKFSEAKKQAIRDQARSHLDNMTRGGL
ncbi:MAG: cryptochrome/photolyase family protein [Holosporales bacterium]